MRGALVLPEKSQNKEKHSFHYVQFTRAAEAISFGHAQYGSCVNVYARSGAREHAIKVEMFSREFARSLTHLLQ